MTVIKVYGNYTPPCAALSFLVGPANFQVRVSQEALCERQTFRSSSFGPESKNAGRFRRYTLSGRCTRLELILKGMNLKPESSDFGRKSNIVLGPLFQTGGRFGAPRGGTKNSRNFRNGEGGFLLISLL